ncbi:3-demethylubiquinone-9 3-methyltransferase UbiG [Fennellomyces sp. T-0311]|nr:3-demethylubiquinone-9 3-methyltransferase UbiG [Fennellomyces sp. T-0311]
MWRSRICQHVGRRRFSTIDASEVRKFSEKSAEWWDPDGEFGMLQLMNPARVHYVRNQLNKTGPKPFENLNMLDIGCGGGLLSESLARLGGRVLGADASPDNIKMAQYHKRQDPQLWRGPGQLEYKHTTAEDLLAAKESFDVVLAMEIIEHVNNPLQFLQTCADLVRPGGSLFLSTMSRTFASYFFTVALAEDILGLVHQGTHDWTKYINSQELTSAIESMGQDWSVQDVRGIFWDPACRKWRIAEKGIVGPGGLESLEVNYLLAAKKKEQ